MTPEICLARRSIDSDAPRNKQGAEYGADQPDLKFVTVHGITVLRTEYSAERLSSGGRASRDNLRE